ncbi:CheR family methyltransferase [Paenibacillus sp. GCM10012303]|uniref:CheR family methyltransferase n=1 Tax=Paenibacillus sp. GCM10012303 TaxID=3317340 RepID=UPI0036150BD4
MNTDDLMLQPADLEAEETHTSELEKIEVSLLLEGLYRLYGFDFRNYVRTSITRRIMNRVRMEKLPSITALLDKVLHHPDMAKKLLGDFSINVTEMFRDPAFFTSFRQNVVPLLRELPEIRIWHAGCSTGEEVYSMAILLQEEGLAARTQLFATDMNEHVLERARASAFPLARMQGYTKNYLLAGGSQEFSAYYTTDHEFAYFQPELSRNIHFFQHNLVTDRSFNEFHVIICRNVLIYFDTVLQNKVHSLFDESLHPTGILALGSKESLLAVQQSGRYTAMDCSQKIYRKVKTV